jgi:hypothetical protein
MKQLTIKGSDLVNKHPNETSFVLWETSGELLGISVKPDVTENDQSKKMLLTDRGLLPLIEINKQKLIASCGEKHANKSKTGIKYLIPHKSNMLDINFKFSEGLVISGFIRDVVFYLNVD